MKNFSRHRRPSRRGAILVAALVCLLIVMALLGGMLLAALQMTRQLPVERDLRQCDLLLQAGIDRALSRATKESDYRGETWSLPADSSAGIAESSVTIEVTPSTSGSPSQVKILAEYRLGNETSIRRSRQFPLPPKSNSVQE